MRWTVGLRDTAVSPRHHDHLHYQVSRSPWADAVRARATGCPLTLSAAHEHLHKLETLDPLGLWGYSSGYQVWTGPYHPKTLAGRAHRQGGVGTHLASKQWEDLQHHAAGSALRGHTDGDVGHTHPAGDTLRSWGGTVHAPSPPNPPWPCWDLVSLEPGRVDLQGLLGAGQSAKDPGLGSCSAALLLSGPSAPDLSCCHSVSKLRRSGERLQLEALRVLGDVVSPQSRLL